MDDDEQHVGFVELEELVSCNNEFVWKERARWIKLEEDVEECANRWGKPHIPCLTFHSLREVEKNLRNGVFLLDLEKYDLLSICEAIVAEIKTLRTLNEEECESVKSILLTRHEHQYQQKGGKHRARNIARRISRIMPQGQRSKLAVNMPHNSAHSSSKQQIPEVKHDEEENNQTYVLHL